MNRLSCWVVGLSVCVSACGNSEGGTYPGAGASGGSGGGSGGSSAGSSSGGKGGTIGAGGSAGTIGAGGSTAGAGGSAAGAGGTAAGTGGSAGAPANCPETAAGDGSPCSQAGLSCFYEDCDGAGRSLAQCVSSSWSVQTEACATFFCGGGDECMPGQICSIQQGGAFIGMCMENPCGTGPVTCECVNSACPGACSVSAYQGTGITVTCNTCPQGGCP